MVLGRSYGFICLLWILIDPRLPPRPHLPPVLRHCSSRVPQLLDMRGTALTLLYVSNLTSCSPSLVFVWLTIRHSADLPPSLGEKAKQFFFDIHCVCDYIHLSCLYQCVHLQMQIGARKTAGTHVEWMQIIQPSIISSTKVWHLWDVINNRMKEMFPICTTYWASGNQLRTVQSNTDTEKQKHKVIHTHKHTLYWLYILDTPSIKLDIDRSWWERYWYRTIGDVNWLLWLPMSYWSVWWDSTKIIFWNRLAVLRYTQR